MKFRSVYRGGVLFVDVYEDVSLTSDLGPLYALVRAQIAQRQMHFALSFTPGSFLYSHHIAVIIKCLERVREADGSLAVVRPNGDLAEALGYIDPEGFIRRVVDEKELAAVGVIA